jgi:hypothetical protein
VAACLLRPDELPPASRRVAILSGGNVDPVLLAGLLGSAGQAGQAGQAGAASSHPSGAGQHGPGERLS